MKYCQVGDCSKSSNTNESIYILREISDVLMQVFVDK